MTARRLTEADYPTLTALWLAGADSANLYWPGGLVKDQTTGQYAVPDWAQYACYGSFDASGLRLATACEHRPMTLSIPGQPDIPLSDEQLYTIGPRAGLTNARTRTAYAEISQVWLDEVIAAGRGSGTAWGVVPTTWPVKLRAFYDGWGPLQALTIPRGYWPRESSVEWILFYAQASALRAAL